MKIKKRLARVYNIFYACDDCDEQLVKSEGMTPYSYFIYVCPKCNKVYRVEEEPHVVYEPAGVPTIINEGDK